MFNSGLSGATAFAASGPGIDDVSASNASAFPGRLVRLPDGRRLNFRCVGTGSPTVLLEGGFAATSLAWDKVQSLVAPTLRACAYDRAGYGFSDPGPLPRDGSAVARDLDDGLRSAGITGPFILVGHSAGGLYMRIFADRRPRDVAGMVFVDPSTAYQDRRFAAVFGEGAGSLAGQRARAARCLAAAEQGLLPSTDPALAACTAAVKAGQPAAVAAARLAEARRPTTWLTQISELDTLWAQTSAAAVKGRQDYGDLPLVVLTADGDYAAAPEAARARLTALWTSLHKALASLSTRGVQRTVDSSSHLMMRDRPDAIAQAITEVAILSRRPDGTRR